MGARGVHFALDDKMLAALMAQHGAEARLDYVSNVIEAAWDTIDHCETDSAWAYIHAGLTGTDPDRAIVRVAVTRPAQEAIQCAETLAESEDGFAGLTRRGEVAKVATDLARIPAAELGEKVRAAHQHFEADGDPEDAVQYATGWYSGLVEFFGRAARDQRHVIFSVNY